MSIARLLAAGTLVATSLAGCSGDAVAPARLDATARASSVSSPTVEFLTAPGYIGAEQTCTWEVIVSGGQSPHTYTWTTGGSWSTPYGGLEEVSSSLGTMFTGRATTTGTYELTLTVTDAVGRSGSRTVSGEVGLYPYHGYPCDR